MQKMRYILDTSYVKIGGRFGWCFVGSKTAPTGLGLLSNEHEGVPKLTECHDKIIKTLPILLKERNTFLLQKKILIVLLIILASAGSGFVRSNLACKFCKQRELGCPAEQLFSKSKK